MKNQTLEENKKIKEYKLWRMEIHFKHTLEQCEGFHDDRKLFVNMYRLLVETLEEFYALPVSSSLLHVAINDMYNKRFKELEEFKKSLLEREMIKAKGSVAL